MKRKLIVLVAMIATAIAVPAMLLAWGPGRDTYTVESPAPRVTFNSITNNPVHGDERNFVQVRDANAGDETYTENIDVTPGHEYVVFVYYHNNASSSLNASGVGIAHGAYVRAEIPGVIGQGANNVKAVGYVGASNANPTFVWDDISFNNKTQGDIAMSYVPASATIHNFGATDGAALSDSIVTTGAPIGYDALNGDLKGCNEYAGYVTFRVKADQPNFTITKQIRKNTTATGGWLPTVATKPGDKVDYLITYRNTGTLQQDNVTIRDVLPAGISYVEGTTYVVNSTRPEGAQVSDNITKAGINIGNYSPGAAAYIKFTARVAGNDDLKVCGINTIRNTAIAETDNGSKASTVDLTVDKTCTEKPKECKPGIPEGDKRCTVTPPVTPPELPVTGTGANIAAFLGLGALVASIGYYIASRRVTSK